MESQLADDLQHFAALIETLPQAQADTQKELKIKKQTSSRSELVAKLKAKLEETKKSRHKGLK